MGQNKTSSTILKTSFPAVIFVPIMFKVVDKMWSGLLSFILMYITTQIHNSALKTFIEISIYGWLLDITVGGRAQ